MHGDEDPGYDETAKMLGESALFLALDGAGVERNGGSVTPATAVGLTIVDRLRRAGLIVEVEWGQSARRGLRQVVRRARWIENNTLHDTSRFFASNTCE